MVRMRDQKSGVVCTLYSNFLNHAPQPTSPPTPLPPGWMPDRVQALPLPDPREYSEAKWIAYMR